MPFLMHGLADDGKGLDAGFAVGKEVIGHVPVQVIDAGLGHEFLDVDGVRALQLDAFQFLAAQQHVLAFGDLEALDEATALDAIPRPRIDRNHVDAVVGLRIDKVKPNGIAVVGRRIEGDRAGDQRQAQMALPRRTCKVRRPSPRLMLGADFDRCSGKCQLGCGFRRSGPPIPNESGHWFRLMAAMDSDDPGRCSPSLAL
jgi:hypothetical protein